MGSSWVKFRTQTYGLQTRFQTQNMARTSPYMNVVRPPPPRQMGFFSPEAFEYFCLTSVFPSVFQWCLRHAVHPTVEYMKLLKLFSHFYAVRSAIDVSLNVVFSSIKRSIIKLPVRGNCIPRLTSESPEVTSF